MKYPLSILLFCLSLSACTSQQSNLLLNQTLVTDFSDTPFFDKWTEEVNGKRKWKPRFSHLDSINIYNITYLSDGLEVKGFLVKPKREKEYPCLIYNRGGNREFGALNKVRVAYLLGQIASEGYIVIASQYRGNAGGEGQEEFGGADVNDVINLIDVLNEIEQADTSKIGMYGWSRGGMMTYIALTKTDRIKAAVVGGAVSNSFESIKDRPGMGTGVYAELVPNYETQKDVELKKRSAIFWADQLPKNVPLLILHGNADWRVKPEHSLRLALELEKHRVPYRLMIFEGGDHGIREHRKEVDQQIIDWFDKFLKKGAPLPNMAYHGN